MNEIIHDSTPVYEGGLPGGSHMSMLMHQGSCLKLVDVKGGANVSMLLYNPIDKLERYNAPDTLKCQHTFKITRGHCLYSDMGRIFCSVIDDSVGWHDTVGGYLGEAHMLERWGKKSYQEFRNDWTQSGEHCFAIEMAKYGLGKRDMTANLNWFSRVHTDDGGNLQFRPDNSQPGDHVLLRFDMDTLVILNTCPHPMDPAKEYPRRDIRYEIYTASPRDETDNCMNLCDENRRGFKNNDIYHAGRGC